MGLVLGSVQNVVLCKMLIGVHPPLDLAEKGPLWSASRFFFPLGGLIQYVDVGGFIL